MSHVVLRLEFHVRNVKPSGCLPLSQTVIQWQKVIQCSTNIYVPDVLSQVDKHIRRLDADLARFEAELKEKPSATSASTSSSSGLLKTQKDGKTNKDKPTKDKQGTSDTDTCTWFLSHNLQWEIFHPSLCHAVGYWLGNRKGSRSIKVLLQQKFSFCRYSLICSNSGKVVWLKEWKYL